jgi:anti-sigma factor RsiW
MCEFSAKLVAWMDGEVAPGVAAEMERHLAECAECRTCIAEFRKVSEQFTEYCNETLAAEQGSAARQWAPALCGAAALAASLLALITVFVPRAPRSSAPAAAVAVVAPSRSGAPPKPAGRTIDFADHAYTAKRPTAWRAPVRKGVTNAASAAHCSPSCIVAKNTAPLSNAAGNAVAMQIAIPAESMFPPGALPEGMSFVAEVQVGADGNVRQLELRPELVSLQRRSN